MRKGDIYAVDLASGHAGHEQSGLRPGVVVGAATAGIVPVVPLTSNLRAKRFKRTVIVLPDSVNRLESRSVALVFHI